MTCTGNSKWDLVVSLPYYDRTSVAPTLMALYHGYFELVLEFLTKKNPIAANAILFGIISGDFLLYFDKVCCMYSLESPHRGDFNESTEYTCFRN